MSLGNKYSNAKENTAKHYAVACFIDPIFTKQHTWHLYWLTTWWRYCWQRESVSRVNLYPLFCTDMSSLNISLQGTGSHLRWKGRTVPKRFAQGWCSQSEGAETTDCVKDVAVCVTLGGYQVHTSLFVPKSHCDLSEADTSHPKPNIAPRLLLRRGSAQWGQTCGLMVCVWLQGEGENRRDLRKLKAAVLQITLLWFLYE